MSNKINKDINSNVIKDNKGKTIKKASSGVRRSPLEGAYEKLQKKLRELKLNK